MVGLLFWVSKLCQWHKRPWLYPILGVHRMSFRATTRYNAFHKIFKFVAGLYCDLIIMLATTRPMRWALKPWSLETLNVQDSRLRYGPLAHRGTGSDLGLDLTTSSLRHWEAEQLLGLFNYIILFSLYQSSVLICTRSRNQRNSRRTFVWRKQDFSSSISGSDLLFAVCTYVMRMEGQNSSVF